MIRSQSLLSVVSLLAFFGAGCGSKALNVGEVTDTVGNSEPDNISVNTSVHISNQEESLATGQATESEVPELVAAVDSDGEPVLNTEGEPLFVPNPDKPSVDVEKDEDEKLTEEIPSDPDERPKPIVVEEITSSTDLCETYGLRTQACTGESKLAGKEFCAAQINDTNSVECSSVRIDQFVCLSNLSCSEMKMDESCAEERVHSHFVCLLEEYDYSSDVDGCEDFVIRNTECNSQTDNEIKWDLYDCAEYAEYFGEEYSAEDTPGCDITPMLACLSKLDCTGIEAETGCEEEVNKSVDACSPDEEDKTPQVCTDIVSRQAHCGDLGGFSWGIYDCQENMEETQNGENPAGCLAATEAYYECAVNEGNCENGYPFQNTKCNELLGAVEENCDYSDLL